MPTDNKILNGSGLTTLVSLIKKNIDDTVAGVTALIPHNVSELENDEGYITASDLPDTIIVDSALAVGTTIASISVGEVTTTLYAPAQVQSDWNIADSTEPSYIANKPPITFTGNTITVPGTVIVGNDPENSDEVATKGYVDGLVSGITPGEMNVIEGIEVNGDEVSPVNKIVSITIPSVPTNVSAFTNDAGYITLAQVEGQAQADWAQSNTTSVDYIKNKPEIPTAASFTATYDSIYKKVQTAVTDPIASGNTISFISEITQNAQGEITLNKKTVPNASSLVAGIAILGAAGGAATYGHTHTLASDSSYGFMSSSDKIKLDGIESGAEENVQSDWAVSSTTSDAYILNKPTISYDDVNQVLVMSGF